MSNCSVNIIAFIIFALLWLAFGAALLFNPATLDAIWQVFRGWPFILQLLVGLLFLPVILGLWAWESSWPFLLRLLLVLGLAWVNIYLFFPRKTSQK